MGTLSMHQCTCVVYIPTCSLTTGTYFAWVNCSNLLIIYFCVPSQCEYTLVLVLVFFFLFTSPGFSLLCLYSLFSPSPPLCSFHSYSRCGCDQLFRFKLNLTCLSILHSQSWSMYLVSSSQATVSVQYVHTL